MSKQWVFVIIYDEIFTSLEKVPADQEDQLIDAGVDYFHSVGEARAAAIAEVTQSIDDLSECRRGLRSITVKQMDETESDLLVG